MISIKRIRSALILGVTLAGVAFANPGEPRPAPPPPTPPTPAAFALSPEIIRAAAAYEAYMARASAMNPNFQSASDVDQALRLGANDEPSALLRGEIAYAAVAALQDPRYVANVRLYALDDQGRAQLAGLIERDPRYVLGLRGADTAAGLAIAALMEQGRKLMATGAAVKQSAYDVQHQAWSRESVPDREVRLASAKNSNAEGFNAQGEDAQRLRRAAEGYDPLPLSGPAASQPYPPVVIRGLAVAALALLGEAGPENDALVEPLLTEPGGATCLHMAKSYLYECLAVAKPYYEDVFCLGEHIMSDVGQCVMIDAGAPVPPAPSTLVPAAPASSAPAITKHRRHRAA